MTAQAHSIEPTSLKTLVIREETPDLMFVQTEEIPKSLRASFVNPGQRARVGRAEHTAQEVPPCSVPGGAHWNFLVEKTSSLGSDLGAMSEGDPLELWPATGEGWSVHAHSERDLIFVADGVGLGLVRPALLTILCQRSKFRKVSLYAGASEASRIPFERELDLWEKSNVDVVRVIRGAVPEDWSGRRGSLVQAIREDRPSLKLADAFVAVPPAKVSEIAGVLTECGLYRRRIHFEPT